ncbi:MAG: response regulator transcription factor [Planctomycetota bacterium]|nr:MAG: response regulator transcription factor [Planctomycetota bacterium]
MPTVLVVEDDPAIRRGVCDALRFSGYQVVEASDGAAGLELALRGAYELVLLDVLMPKRDGFSVLEELRKVHPSLPVIMLTARGAEEDRVRGLRRGADDYVVKPFSMSELVARADAVLRRSAERPKGLKEITIAGRHIDFERREALLADGARVALTEKEAALVAYLANHRERAITRDELLRCVWGLDPKGVQTRTVDMAVTRLRERLGDDPAAPRVIVTVRSKGYMLGLDA